MAKDTLRLLLPTGRLVGGDLYNAKPVTDDTGAPKLIKKGDNAGKQLTNCYTPIALAKTKPTFLEEPWFAEVVAFAKKVWPNQQPQRKDFAWKVTDGDSTDLNRNNKRACDRDGYPGHWVLQLSGISPPNVLNSDGSKGYALVSDVPVKAGDHVQAYIKVTSNESTQTAGLYMEATHVAFQREGDAIVGEAIDASTIGFGQAVAGTAQAATPAPPPRTEFSTGAGAPPPPPPAAPVDRRTQKGIDSGSTFEQMMEWEGWNEQSLIQHGYITA